MIPSVLLTDWAKVPFSDFSSPADANFPALSAAIIKPSTPANKLTSANASSATPVLAFNDP